MKSFKWILYMLLAISALLSEGCNEEPMAVDYADDSAFPPPVVTLSTQTSLETAEYRKNETITGSSSDCLLPVLRFNSPAPSPFSARPRDVHPEEQSMERRNSFISMLPPLFC